MLKIIQTFAGVKYSTESTAYDTIASIYKVDKTSEDLKQLLIMKKLAKTNINGHDVYVLCKKQNIDINLFPYPLLIDTPTIKNAIVVDLRLYNKYIRFDENTNSVEIYENTPAYELARMGIFNKIYNSENPNKIIKANPVIKVIYGRWLANAISREYGIDFRDYAVIASLTTSFFLTRELINHGQHPVYNASILGNLSATLQRDCNLAGVIVTEVMNKLVDRQIPENVEELCDEIKFILDDIRLKKFNSVALYTIISSGWFGNNNPRELMSVCVDFPPGFLAVLETVVNNTAYKRTPLADAYISCKSNRGAKELSKDLRLL